VIANQRGDDMNYLLVMENFLDSRSDTYAPVFAKLVETGDDTFILDFIDLYDFDPEIATILLHRPDLLKDFSSEVHGKLVMRAPEYAAQLKTKLKVSLRNLPVETPLREIGAQNINQFVQTTGIIVRRSEVKPYIEAGAWECPSCHETILLSQSGEHLIKPTECPSCENRRKFKLDHVQSHFSDAQYLTIQELPESLPPGELPQQVSVLIKNKLVNMMRPGERITLVGVVKLKMPAKSKRLFTTFIEATYLAAIEREDLEVTADDIAKIEELAMDPFLDQKIIKSIAPSIHGHNRIKEAISDLLFSGVAKSLPDIRIRGDINVLLVGDPGVAKSQFLRYTAVTSPRGLLTSGRGSTAAGLTASVSREAHTGNMVLEAGALVLGDLGTVCIDELDKMRDDDRDAIHYPMEQQTVPIAKGGIIAELNARCAILAAANPTMGRYNAYQTVAQNIKIPVTILSRFDLIFVVRDRPETGLDSTIAVHVLDTQMENGNVPKPPIDPLLLRKYIAYAKKMVRPKLTQEASDTIKAFYVRMREAGLEGGRARAGCSPPPSGSGARSLHRRTDASGSASI